jgi:hypothetical protein
VLRKASSETWDVAFHNREMIQATIREAFVRLTAELPYFEAGGDPDEQIRSVLRPLIDRALRSPPIDPIEPDPATCPNCGKLAVSERSPYCSTFCREQSAYVRRFRNSIATELIYDSERQAALGTALWSLQGGGFPRRQLMVPDKVVAKVIAREGGVCAVCGAPATEIDHVGSG